MSFIVQDDESRNDDGPGVADHERSRPEPEPGLEPQPELEAEAWPGPAAQAGPEHEAGPGPGPEAQAEPEPEPEPKSGTPENPLEITDPRALRALAHPARLAILQHLALDGPATATECAEVAGLSPSACSYHLRALARYGFVDEDPAGGADGRHRPWRARVVAMKAGSDPSRPAAFRAASRLLTETLQARSEEVRALYLDREAEYSPEWQQAAGWGQDVLHVTPAELDEVRTKIYAVIAEYRRLKREDQPPGARRVHVLLDFTPWFTPDADV